MNNTDENSILSNVLNTNNLSFDSSTVNTLIEQINKMKCGKDCKDKIQIQKLKQKYDEAVYNEQNSEKILFEAEKEFLIKKLGNDGYNKRAANIKEKEINEYVTQLKSELKNNTGEIDEIMNKTEKHHKILEQIKTLLKSEKEKNKELNDSLNKILNSNTTNQRKFYYEQQQQEWLDEVNTGILYCYYGLLILYILCSNFIWENNYRNLKIWFFIILYAVVPYFGFWFVGMLFWAYNKIIYIFTNKLSKDVYYNL